MHSSCFGICILSWENFFSATREFAKYLLEPGQKYPVMKTKNNKPLVYMYSSSHKFLFLGDYLSPKNLLKTYEKMSSDLILLWENECM